MEKTLSKSIQEKKNLLSKSQRFYFILFLRSNKNLQYAVTLKKRLKIKTLLVEQNVIFTTNTVELNSSIA